MADVAKPAASEAGRRRGGRRLRRSRRPDPPPPGRGARRAAAPRPRPASPPSCRSAARRSPSTSATLRRAPAWSPTAAAAARRSSSSTPARWPRPQPGSARSAPSGSTRLAACASCSSADQVAVGAELVADAAHREHQLGPLRVALDLLAQVRDVDVAGSLVAVELGLPELLHDLRAGEDLAGAADEQAQQLELRAGQVDRHGRARWRRGGRGRSRPGRTRSSPPGPAASGRVRGGAAGRARARAARARRRAWSRSRRRRPRVRPPCRPRRPSRSRR